MQKNRIWRIIFAIIIALIIVAVPLSVKIIGDAITQSDSSKGDKDYIEVTLSIGAKSLFREENIDYLHTVKTELDNASEKVGYDLYSRLNNGDILVDVVVRVPYGATVMEVTRAVCASADVLLSASSTYVSSIAGLREKMAGSHSGWVYTIDGEVVMVGAGSARLVGGENIVWKYIVGER